MTQPNQSSQEMFDLQRLVGANYLTILQEIQAIGVDGYLRMIDACTEEELRALAQAGDVVYNQLQKFKAKQAGG